MTDTDFEKLCESVKEAGKIKKDTKTASRTFVHEDPNPQEIRANLGLSQSRFAAIIGVSVRTLQNWEQGRRQPEGPAKALLRVVEHDPEAVLHALNG